MPGPSTNLWRDTRWRESGWTRARAALALGMVLGLGSVGTMAKWSDTATAETGLFSTGSIDLLINDQSPSYAFASMNNIDRGQSRSGMINLKNQGSTNLTYLMNLRVEGLTTPVTTAGQQRGDAAALGNKLQLDLYAGGTSDGTTCSSGALVTSQPTLSVGGDRTLIGTARPIAATTTASLCAKATLAADAPIESRMAQVRLTFTANASLA